MQVWECAIAICWPTFIYVFVLLRRLHFWPKQNTANTHTQTEINPTPGSRYDPGGWANSHHTREISWCCMWCLVTRKQSQPCQSLRPETFCMQVYKYTANTWPHCTIEHESCNSAAVTNLVGVTLLLL